MPITKPLLNDGSTVTSNDNYTFSPGGTRKKSFKSTYWRYLTLFFACCFLMGSYFCYDNPGVLETYIEHEFDIS